MRITLNLPDDIYEAARSFAAAKGLPLGEAIAELIRRGFSAPPRIAEASPFPSFAVPPDAPPITLEQTLAAEDHL